MILNPIEQKLVSYLYLIDFTFLDITCFAHGMHKTAFARDVGIYFTLNYRFSDHVYGFLFFGSG